MDHRTSPAPPPAAPAHTARHLRLSSLLMACAGLAAAAGNYAFQAMMGRLLAIDEFGYLNAAIGLTGMLGVGMAAASHAVTHHLARHQVLDDQQKIAELKAASSTFLLWFTLVASLVALGSMPLVARVFEVPRMTIAWVITGVVLAGLWSGLAGAWCAGLGQFQFLAVLNMGQAGVRLLGVGLVLAWPRAESSLGASLLAGVFVVVAVLWRDAGRICFRGPVKPILNREFLAYLAAALAVVGGQFLFLQSDLLAAQRQFPGETLGLYSAAGLFGRAVVWLSLPVLTVFFTARSSRERRDRGTTELLLYYVGLLAIGAVGVTLARPWLCQLLLGRQEPVVLGLMPNFAGVMVVIGLLQAFGAYLLASRRLGLSLLFGLLALGYAAVLNAKASVPATLVQWIGLAGGASLVLLGAISLWTKRTR